MQGTRYRASGTLALVSIFELAVTNVEVVKTAASFLPWCNFWSSGLSYYSYSKCLRDVPLRVLTITSLLFLAFYDLSDINPRCSEATVLSFLSLSFSLVFLSFLFLFDLCFGFFGNL